MLDLARWVRFRWQLKTDLVVGDTKYGTIPNIVALEEDGLQAFVPTPNRNRSHQYYSMDLFHYDDKQDVYICPQGQMLYKANLINVKQQIVYRADAEVCKACQVRAACTTNKLGRAIHRSFFEAYLDRVKDYAKTEA